MADNINTYQGNAALGQGTAGQVVGPVGVYDMKNVNDAMDKQMQYQYLENRDIWARNNLLVDQQAKQAAADLTFTMGDWLEGDRSIIMDKIKKMNDLYTKYPNRTRLLADGSNQKEVAEWQQIHNEIEADIRQANRRKTQQIALLQQEEGATDELEKEDINKWRVNYEKTDINHDILLFPSFTPYQPKATPSETFDVVTYDKNGNIETKVTSSVPNISYGISQIEYDRSNSKTATKANKTISSGVNGFNEALRDILNKNPELANDPDKLLAKLSADNRTKSLMTVIEHSNKLVKLNNDNKDRAGFSEVNFINAADGLDELDYMTIMASGYSSVPKVETETKYPKIGLEEAQLALQRRRVNIDEKQLNFNISQANEGKIPDKQMMELKYGQMYNLKTAPYQPGAKTNTDGSVEIPVTAGWQEVFGEGFEDTQIQKQVGKEGDVDYSIQTTKANKTNVQKIVVHPGPGGPLDYENVTVEVTTTDPRNPKEPAKTTIYAGTDIDGALNNVYGKNNALKVGGADGGLKRLLQKPKLDLTDVYGPNAGKGLVPAKIIPTNTNTSQGTQAPANTTVPAGKKVNNMPRFPDGSVDISKIIPGEYYIDKQGRVYIPKPL